MLLSPTAWKFARALVLVTVSVSYLAYVFRFSEWLPRTRGLGDWQDPYFINALLEHWYRSATSFTDPSSPPMYFPAQKTLAYSHGLILYAPFYVALRLFFHPFHAYTITLFAVLELGILCLYALLRRLGLSFIESLLLTALFFSSRNVVGWETGVWSQRASVFLIPPILLLLLISGRARPRAASLLMGGLAGMLSTLLYVQDFYTAHFAFLLLAIFVVAAAVAGIGRSMIPSRRWFAAVGVGALAGAFVFLWIYFGAYAEHRSFPEEQLLRSLTVRNPSRWRSPLAFIRDLGSYEGLRSFALVFIVGTLAWIPWFEVDRKTRIQSAWFLAISLVVLLIPLRFPEFSLWRALFQRLPGFGVIRDPRRIIQVYELVVVLAMALFLVRLPKSAGRLSIALLVLVLLAAERNPETFDYQRPIAVYQRWVAAPIAIDPACTSFYIKGASEDYMSRSGHMWSLYAVDSLFVSLTHGIPTLNGYSAWFPDSWDLPNPQEPAYADGVARWIHANGLTRVCELDIEARTMRLRQ